MYTNEMMEQLQRCSQDVRHFKTYLTDYSDVHAELLWELMFTRYINVLFVTKTQDEACDIVEDFMRLYEQLPDWLRCNVASYNKRSRRFDNGSQILTQLAGPTTGKGMTVSFLVFHKYDTWAEELQRSVYAQCVPCIGYSGRLIKD